MSEGQLGVPISRCVSEGSSPTLDLNHCRSESTKDTNAIGVPHIVDTSSVNSSIASGRMKQKKRPIKTFAVVDDEIVVAAVNQHTMYIPSGGVSNNFRCLNLAMRSASLVGGAATKAPGKRTDGVAVVATAVVKSLPGEDSAC
jgi:hypothetical protein